MCRCKGSLPLVVRLGGFIVLGDSVILRICVCGGSVDRGGIQMEISAETQMT